MKMTGLYVVNNVFPPFSTSSSCPSTSILTNYTSSNLSASNDVELYSPSSATANEVIP